MRKCLPWIFLLAPISSVLADHSFGQPTPLEPTLPWLTGPLIAPVGTVVPKGHYGLQLYLYFLVNTGIYNQRWDTRSTRAIA